MRHLLLLGRQAMKGNIIVDPEFNYIATQQVNLV
jgi:hypothetical protein